MTISKKTVAKTTVLPGGANEQEILVVEPTLDSDEPPHGAPKPSAGGRAAGIIVRFLTSLVLLGAVGAGWVYRDVWWPKVAPLIGLDNKPPTKPPKPPVPVVTAVAQQKDMDVFINGLGTVTAFKTVTIRSRVEGELVKVAFTEGQMVCAGDLLAQIDRRPFDVQLQQAEGQLARDEATLATAELTLKRDLELLKLKNIAQQNVDEQRALVQQTTGIIQSDRANIANAKLQLDYCHIIAPVSGRIGLRLVDQGNIVRANDPLGMAVITQLQPISLVFTIPQDDISRVQKSAKDGHELEVLAYDRGLKIKLAAGKLLAIDNQVDATTGTVKIKAIFDNEDGMLFPNQFVNARLLVDRKKNATVVPTAAIQRGPSNFFVYVVREEGDDKVVDLRPVTPGLSEGSETCVDAGLTPGEVVVTDGVDKLQKEAKVQIRDPEKEKLEREKKGESGKGKSGAGDKKSGDGEKKPRTGDKMPDGSEKQPGAGERKRGTNEKTPDSGGKKPDSSAKPHEQAVKSASQPDMKTSP